MDPDDIDYDDFEAFDSDTITIPDLQDGTFLGDDEDDEDS